MSIASRIFVAAALAAGLAAPTGAHAALQGFSIALTDVTLAYDPAYPGNTPDLSATAAAFGGMPAFPLPHNGSYTDTLTGDYAVTDNLPPLDKSEFWLDSYEITLNGVTIFKKDNNGPIGPYSAAFIWEAFLNVSGNPTLANIVAHYLENNDHLDTPNGVLDYKYNFAPDDRDVGTFAVGSTMDLYKVLNFPEVFPVGTSTLSLSFSIFAVPEPPTWLTLGAGFLVIGVMRSQAGRFRSARPFSGRLRPHLARLSWKKS